MTGVLYFGVVMCMFNSCDGFYLRFFVKPPVFLKTTPD